MGLPSGLLWAKSNIDVSRENGFAASGLTYDCSFFSWGNIDGHNVVDGTSFGDWSFGDANSGEPYASSPGHLLSADIDIAHDAARQVCGYPWRMPSIDDYNELLNPLYTEFINENGDVIIGDDKRFIIDNIRCVRLRSKINGNTITFATTGYASENSLDERAISGGFWTTHYQGSSASAFKAGDTVTVGSSYRYRGLAIRPVFKV